MAETSPQRMAYRPELDGLRFVAFFLVFITHVGLLPRDVLPPWFQFPATLYNIVSAWGWVGVDLFFVLSGFLITSLLLIERSNTGSVSFRDFFFRRMLRIWPLYYLALVGGCIILYALGAMGVLWPDGAWWPEFVRYLLPYFAFLGNFVMVFLPTVPYVAVVLGILWSISVEEQFYVIWGSTMSRVPQHRALMWLLLGALVVSVASRLVIVQSAVSHNAWYANTLSHLDPLVLGALLAIGMHAGYITSATLRRWGGGMLLLSVAILTCVMAFFPPIELNDPRMTWVMLLVAVACVLLLASAIGCARFGSVLGLSPVAGLGRLTYGLYIFHPVGIYLAEFAAKPYLPQPVNPLVIWLVRLGPGFLVTLLLAYVSWHAYEKRFMAMKSRFSRVQYEQHTAG